MSFAMVRFARTDSGLSSLEYAVAVIVLAVSAGLAVLGGDLRGVIETIAARVPAVVAPQ